MYVRMSSFVCLFVCVHPAASSLKLFAFKGTKYRFNYFFNDLTRAARSLRSISGLFVHNC